MFLGTALGAEILIKYLLTIFIIKIFGQDEYGFYQIFLNYSVVLGMLFCLGTNLFAQKHISKGETFKNDVKKIFLIISKMRDLLFLGLLIFISVLSFSGNSKLFTYIIPIFISGGLIYAYQLISSKVCNALGMYITARVISELGLSLLLLMLLISMNNHFFNLIEYRIIIQLFLICVSIIIISYMFNKEIKEPLNYLFFKPFLYFSDRIKFWSVSIFRTTNTKIDALVLPIFLSLEDIGIYYFAKTIASSLGLGQSAITEIFSTKVSKCKNYSEITKATNDIHFLVKINLIFLLFVFSFIMILTPSIANFSGITTPLKTMLSIIFFHCLIQFIEAIFGPSASLLTFQNQEKNLIKQLIISSFVSILLLSIFAYFWGVVGVSVAFVVITLQRKYFIHRVSLNTLHTSTFPFFR